MSVNIPKEWLKAANDDLLDTLNELYIDSRYPGDMGLMPYGKPTLEDAQGFYNFAQKIFYQVCGIVEIEKDSIYNTTNS